MLCLNIDIDFFTHPKVEGLTDILGDGSEIHLIRLWAYVAKHCRTTGGRADWSRDNLEAKARWFGESGLLVDTLLELKLIHPWKNGFKVHDWKQHAAHLIYYDEKCKINSKNAKRGWKKRRNAQPDNALEPPNLSMRVALPKPEIRNAKTKQNKTETHSQSACGNFEDSLSPTYQQVVDAWRAASGVKSLDANTKQGARELAQAVDAGELPIGDVAAVIRNGLDDKSLPNQGLRGIARRFTHYLPKEKTSGGPLTHVVEFVCDSCGHTEEQRLTKGNPLYPKLCKKNGCDGRMQPNVKEE